MPFKLFLSNIIHSYIIECIKYILCLIQIKILSYIILPSFRPRNYFPHDTYTEELIIHLGINSYKVGIVFAMYWIIRAKCTRWAGPCLYQHWRNSQNQIHFQLLIRILQHYNFQFHCQNHYLNNHQRLYTLTSMFQSILESKSL